MYTHYAPPTPASTVCNDSLILLGVAARSLSWLRDCARCSCETMAATALASSAAAAHVRAARRQRETRTALHSLLTPSRTPLRAALVTRKARPPRGVWHKRAPRGANCCGLRRGADGSSAFAASAGCLCPAWRRHARQRRCRASRRGAQVDVQRAAEEAEGVCHERGHRPGSRQGWHSAPSRQLPAQRAADVHRPVHLLR